MNAAAQRLPSGISVADRLMIVRFSVSQWRPRKFDRKASDEVAEIHGLHDSRDVGRFNKILIDLDSIKPVRAALREVEKAHYSMTAPWWDDGSRVLPADLFFDYATKVRDGRVALDAAVRRWVDDEYPTQVERARRRLGTLFREADYPSAEDIASCFGIRVRFAPIPNPEDARVWSIGEQAAAEIEQSVRADIERTVADAQQHVVDRVVERASEFVKKVRRFDRGDTNQLRTTAIENLRYVVGLVLRGLNVQQDQRLDAVARELEAAVAGLTPYQLKHSETLRRDRATEVEDITRRFAGAFGGHHGN